MCLKTPDYVNFKSRIGGAGEGNQEDEEIAAEDEEDMGVIETYSNYMPTKLKVT